MLVVMSQLVPAKTVKKAPAAPRGAKVGCLGLQGVCRKFMHDLEKMDTRRRVMEVARALFWKGGYASVSVDDICDAAGVRKGSFYHFFSSKADLLVAAMEEDKAAFFEEVKAACSPDLPPRAWLDTFVGMVVESQRQLLATYGRVVGACYATIGSEMGPQDAVICEKSNEMMWRVASLLEPMLKNAQRDGLLDAGDDTKMVARQMCSASLGVLVQARMLNDITIIEQDLPMVMGRFLNDTTGNAPATKGRK
jgi:TetR/AcrR family transcriptional repressor of nem operon